MDAAAPTLARSPSPKPVAVEHADPELMKLFIEEAHEELSKIQHNFTEWDQNPLERDALVTVRRSFHTLKGSGRMVGARELCEFAWSIENLLNRLLDNTLTRSPAILETLRAAVAALPELIAQLESGTPVRADIAAISSRAHALAAGRGTTRAAEAEEEAAGEATSATYTLSDSTIGRVVKPAAGSARSAPTQAPATAAQAAPRQSGDVPS